MVICPHCLASFRGDLDLTPSRQARKEESKSRRSRDDDDEDDEEEERPAKKAKAKKLNEDEEEERPRKKAEPKKAKKDDEEETPRKKKKPRADDEGEDEEEEKDGDDETEAVEEEEPIEWTPRKRQLSVCAKGLMAMVVGCYCLVAFTVLTSLAIDCFEFIDDWKTPWIGPFIFNWFALPLLVLGVTAIVVALVMNLWVPSRAEGKGSLVTGLIFATLVYFLGLLTLLTMLRLTVADNERAERFIGLLAGGTIICFIISMVAAMAYLSQLMRFLKLHLEASQSITNIGFILLSFALLLGLVYASPVLKGMADEWMKFVVALLAIVVSGFAIRMLTLHVFLIMKVRRTIAAYIKDS